MSVKVYIKRGIKNYKENKLINKLTEAIEKKIKEDPSFAEQYTPATNFSELKSQYDTYCIEDVEFEEKSNEESNPQEIKEIEENNEHKEFRKGMENSIKNENESSNFDNDSIFIDPLNREEPTVRDYVINDGFSDNTTKKLDAPKSNFAEPTSFQDAFEMPSDDLNDNNNKSTSNQGAQKQNNQKKSEPLNPQWDEMKASKQKKSTKKFAKYIVEAVCMLSEKGFVWFANKDINESKLTEYELSGEMDLNLLVTLEDGQEATVKQFFQLQCMKAEQFSKIDPEQKQDLIDALAEVMQEKGVGPTPTQELALIALTIFGGQAVALFTLKSQTNSLLTQLRAMKSEETQYQQQAPPPPRPQPKPQPQQEYKEEPKKEEKVYEQEVEQNIVQQQEYNYANEGDFSTLDTIIDNPINTIE